MAVQFRDDIDMNGLLITELAPGVAGTDAVNVNQLTASAPSGYAETIGDGVATTFTITHGFNTLDVMVTVIEVATGAHILTTVVNDTVNDVEVTFGVAPTASQYRVLVIPVP
jgi:hypothetical protein